MKSPSVREPKCCLVLTQFIVRTWCCCFITQCLVITVPNGMENGNWACSFFLCCPKMTERQQRILSVQLWREESDGNLDFRYCNFSVEREFHILHLQIAQKTLPRIFIPVKHKAALWKSCYFQGGLGLFFISRTLN